MEIGHLNGYLIVAEAHYPYLVYVTKNKRWSPQFGIRNFAERVKRLRDDILSTL
jgi:hypothetical protein